MMLSENWPEDLKTEIRRRRLQMLKHAAFDFTEQALPRRSPWRAPSYYHWMETWSEKAKEYIADGVSKGAFVRQSEWA